MAVEVRGVAAREAEGSVAPMVGATEAEGTEAEVGAGAAKAAGEVEATEEAMESKADSLHNSPSCKRGSNPTCLRIAHKSPRPSTDICLEAAETAALAREVVAPTGAEVVRAAVLTVAVAAQLVVGVMGQEENVAASMEAAAEGALVVAQRAKELRAVRQAREGGEAVGFVVVEWEVVRVAVARTALATAVARAEAMAAERVREPKGQEVAEETVLVNTMAVVAVVAAVGTGQVTPEKVEAERPPWPWRHTGLFPRDAVRS